MGHLGKIAQLARPLQSILSSSTAAQGAAAQWCNSHVCSMGSCASPSGRASPSSTQAFQVEVGVKAFEKRYVQQASTTIRDLMMLNFAPKSRSVLPVAEQTPEPANLFMPTEQDWVKLNWKKTRFTVIRGPHIDKQGMEQFEMRKYKVMLRASTNSSLELQWFLDSLKSYEFTGVQLQVLVTSSNYLTPSELPSTSSSSDGGVLSAHRQKYAKYILPSSASKEQQAASQMQETLGALRKVVYTGLSDQRQRLQRDKGYQSWHYKAKLSSNTASSKPDLDNQPLQPLESALQHLSSTATSKDPATTQCQKTAAFLAAVDAVFLNMRFATLEAHHRFPHHFATYQLGTTSALAPQWMHAVLKYGQYAQKVNQMTHEEEVMRAYTNYNLFSHALLYTLFKMWFQQTTGEMKDYLALPPKAELEAFMTRSRSAGAAGRQ